MLFMLGSSNLIKPYNNNLVRTFHQIPLPDKLGELQTGVQHWVGFQAEALLQVEALLVLEERIAGLL